MKRGKRMIGAFLLLITLGLGLFIALNWEGLEAFPGIISSYYSKELCSCLYVTGQSEEFCHNYVRQYVPIQSFDIDEKQKRVTVTGLWQTNRAHYVDARHGCVLENEGP